MNTSDRELLIRIDERQERMSNDISELRKEVKDKFAEQKIRCDSHSVRIQGLEKYRENLQGKFAIITATVSAGAVALWEVGKSLIIKKG